MRYAQPVLVLDHRIVHELHLQTMTCGLGYSPPQAVPDDPGFV
jgi:hypothetical protein